ncbi:MAG TPA: thioesterase family protein [Gemmata sp.]|nr:thioesterase family protein [Gemmata sp.]
MPHPELVGFPIVVELDVAWGEMDSFAHVNNVVYFRYFENSRIRYLDRVGFDTIEENGIGPILHSTSARFRKPLTYPDHLFVGARVKEMQADRVTFEYRLVSQNLNAVAAEGEAIIVSYDYRKETKCPIQAEVRKKIEELEGRKWD